MVLIKCRNISKSYGENNVIKKFDCEFLENKLYVLAGPSGCGKTTILNILTGVENFNGTVELYDRKFKKRVDDKYAMSTMSYITQDNYFIDYLSVYDNLKLCNHLASDKIIDDYLSKYKILKKKNSFPQELSKGEQQRVAIIMALLQNKNIILLDEPTSSLDEENAEFLIDMLNELKKDHLIICATHDNLLIEHADKKIEVSDVYSESVTDRNNLAFNKDKYKQKKLFRYMLKENFSKKSEKKSNVILFIVFLIVMLAFNLFFDYNEKIESSLLDLYNIRFVDYYCYRDSDEFCDEALKKYNAVYNMYVYNGNLPSKRNVNFASTSKTLPFNKDLLPNSESFLAYGAYYEDEKDIILGIDAAKKISSNLEDLIGEKYYLQMPDRLEEFRIVGILKDIEDDVYMKTMHGNHSINREVYLNDLYVSKYKYDGVDKFNKVEQGFYYMRAYFSSIEDLKKFYDDNQWVKDKTGAASIPESGMVVQKYNSNFIDFRWMVQAIEYYLKPGTFVAFLIALIFYFEIRRIKSKYKSYYLSVYRYYGYSWSKIIINQIASSVCFISFIYLLSFIFDYILSDLLNVLLLKFDLASFTLFIMDYKSILLLYVYLVSISTIFSLMLALFQIKKGWLNTIKEGENFL